MTFITLISLLFAAIILLFVLGPLFTLWTLCFFLMAQTLLTPSVALAESDIKIPPPTILANGSYIIPSVNQFMLVPMQGKLSVYYVGMFTYNEALKETKFQVKLPLPAGFQDPQILDGGEGKNDKPEKTDKADKTKNEGKDTDKKPIMVDGHGLLSTFPLTQGVNQIRVEFSLPAPTGKLQWQSQDLKYLPGVTLIILPEYFGAIRTLTDNFWPSFNLWPIRVSNLNGDFKTSITSHSIGMDVSEQKDPWHSQARLYVNIGSENTPYPEFVVSGIVTTRTYLWALTCGFAFCLFGASVFLIYGRKKTASIVE